MVVPMAARAQDGAPPVASAPIQVIGCTVPSSRLLPESAPENLGAVKIEFRNTASTVANDFIFSVTVEGRDAGTRELRGTFSPDVVVQRISTDRAHPLQSNYGSPDVILSCAVVSVTFADGTVWPAPAIAGVQAPTSSPVLTQTVTPLQQCEQSVAGLSDAVRASQCIAHLGRVQDAKVYLEGYLHSAPPTTPRDDTRALAYDELARFEYRLGQKGAAVAHIKAAYAIDAATASIRVQIKADMKMISLPTYRQIIAAEDAASGRTAAQAAAEAQAQFDADTAGMSADEKQVYKREGGLPDHVESYDSSGGHTETWWYNGDSGNRVGYTFDNGVLTSVYRP